MPLEGALLSLRVALAPGRAAAAGPGPAGGDREPARCRRQHRRRGGGARHRRPHHRPDDQRQHDDRQDPQPRHHLRPDHRAGPRLADRRRAPGAQRARRRGESGAAYIAAARASGDKWNYGTPGVGTVAHLGMELLKSRAGISPVHVPYPGNPQVITAMLGGQVQMSLLPPGLAMPQVTAASSRPSASRRPAAAAWCPACPA
jgi:hypothetical protein